MKTKPSLLPRLLMACLLSLSAQVWAVAVFAPNNQPTGWLGNTVKVDWPILTNLRLDPFERTGMYNGKDNGSIAYYNWFAYQFWRFVLVQQEVGTAARSFIDFPPMQKGASFNMSAVKEQIDAAVAARSVGN